MNYRVFCSVLIIGETMVGAQALTAWIDSYFSQAQLQTRGIVGWSFKQHGAMIPDAVLITPLVAHLISIYKLEHTTVRATVLFIVLTVFTGVMLELWRRGGITMPEAHTHDGKITAAGWIHGIFFLIGFFVLLQPYFAMTEPAISKRDLIVISVLLTPFFFFGAVKYGKAWKFADVQWIVYGEWTLLWGLTTWRLIRT